MQILAAANVQIGGARQAAVTSQPLHVCKVPQLKSGSLYPHLSNNCTLSWVRAILKAQECCEVKLSCFKGIGNPTDIHGSWGTWLGRMMMLMCGSLQLFLSSYPTPWYLYILLKSFPISCLRCSLIHLNFSPPHIQGRGVEVPSYWTNFDTEGREQILLQTSPQSSKSEGGAGATFK